MMNIPSRYQCFRLLVLTVLVVAFAFGGFESQKLNAIAEVYNCDTVINIIGEYQCSGECIVTVDGKKELISVSGEKDTIEYFSSSDQIYQVKIKGDNDFNETEIGSLVDNTLRTATAQVSDNQFPVLEEYIFEANSDGQAKSFTKIVRNPSQGNFKSCKIQCKK